MSWIRMDDGFAEHPKLSALTDREFRIWCRMVGYCARVEDPTVDTITRRNVQGLTTRLVAKFESLSLLDPVSKQHEIHHWIHYQPKDKTGAERQARFRARLAQQSQNNGFSTVTPTVTEPLLAHARSRPVPSLENPEGFSYVVDSWLLNAPPLIRHRDEIRQSSKAQKAVAKGIASYGLQDVCAAVVNYAQVLASPKHYFSHKWTLPDFCTRGLPKFVPEAVPLENFQSKPRAARDVGMTFDEILNQGSEGGTNGGLPALPFRSIA